MLIIIPSYRLAGCHCYIKVTAILVTMDTFLQKNGYELVTSEREAYEIIIKLASEKLSKWDLAIWLKNNTK